MLIAGVVLSDHAFVDLFAVEPILEFLEGDVKPPDRALEDAVFHLERLDDLLGGPERGFQIANDLVPGIGQDLFLLGPVGGQMSDRAFGLLRCAGIV